jgi:hypothetical protein
MTLSMRGDLGLDPLELSTIRNALET